MNKILIYTSFAILAMVSFTSCLDDNSEEWDKYLEELEEQRKQIYDQFLVDSLLIVDYLAEHDSLASFDEENGIFYNIIEQGSDFNPTIRSIVEVKYRGMLLDGTVFDETEEDETAALQLSQLIGGWQLGLPKIGVGGTIILYLPSFYGYGKIAYKTIPANSVLIFQVELLGLY